MRRIEITNVDTLDESITENVLQHTKCLYKQLKYLKKHEMTFKSSDFVLKSGTHHFYGLKVICKYVNHYKKKN